MNEKTRKSFQEIEEKFISLMKEMEQSEEVNKTIETKLKSPRLNIYDLEYIINNDAISNALLGKIIYIPNNGKCSLFIVVDVNHENTINTIDLQTLNNGIIRQPFDLNTNIYKDSSIRKYLNKEYYEGFNDVAKRLMLTMKVKSNGDILEDKVKLISMAEMGLYQYRINGKILYDCDEGERYLIYKHMIKDRGPECVAQMTRSSYSDKSIWCIGGVGNIYHLATEYERYAAPIIRLGKQ